ncbi:MAG: hypothetical protein LBU61_00430 [Coriobacteriales bacterium]|jgi:hypothetical protein|nr:hypothetical protein [Coriobacteriales bacterium]
MNVISGGVGYLGGGFVFLRKSYQPDRRVYISIVRSYKDGKMTRSKTYESHGYFDPANPGYEGELARLQKRADELEEEWQKEHGSMVMEFARDKKIDIKAAGRKSVGGMICF